MPIYGTGENEREWIHVDDHANGILTVLSSGLVGQSYNLGSGVRLRNLDVAKFLSVTMDAISPSDTNGKIEDSIEFVSDRPGHDFRYAMDSSKAMNQLSWQPEVKFEEGLASTIDWYIANDQWWKPITREDYDLARLGKREIQI